MPVQHFGAPRCVPRAIARLRSRCVIGALALATLASIVSPSATAQGATPLPPLSLEAALRLAEQRSYALLAQDAAASAARDQAVAARQLPDPTLRLSINNLPIEGANRFNVASEPMTMRSVGVVQTFTREDKRLARSARYGREAEAAEAMRAAQLVALRRSTALAWLDRHYQQQLVELLGRQRDEAALQIEAAEAAYRAGQGAQADVFLARSGVARIEDRIREAQALVANAITTLERWVGDQAAAPLGEAPTLTRTRFADAFPGDAVPGASALEARIDRHPDIALMAAEEAVALAEAELARRARRSDWSVDLSYSQRGSAFGNMVSIGVSIPLQWDQPRRQNRELAASLARAEQVRSEREEAQRERVAEAQRWRATWRSNLARLDDYERSLIPLAAERTQAALAAYRGGRAPLSDVLEARRMEIDTRSERLRIEMQTAVLWARLEFLLLDEAPAASPDALAPRAEAMDTMGSQA